MKIENGKISQFIVTFVVKLYIFFIKLKENVSYGMWH